MTFSDASGLAVLIGTGRRARRLGGFLRLAAVSPQVDRVLDITGLHRTAVPPVWDTSVLPGAGTAGRCPNQDDQPPDPGPSAVPAAAARRCTRGDTAKR